MKNSKNRNRYEILDNYVVGFTIKNDSFYFDYDDYELIKKYNWHISTTDGYAYTSFPKHKPVTMQQLIMKEFDNDDNLYIDHINRNKIDNRKNNLRMVTKRQNSINRNIQSNNTTGIIGVKKYGNNDKFRVQINDKNGKRIHLGVFEQLEDAIICRLKAELKYFGIEFAPQRHLFEEYNITENE